MNRGEPPKLRRHGSFVGRWLGMYAAMRADDAGPSTDLQTLRERLAMGKTQKTTRRISQNPTMLSRQEGLLLFNPPDGKLALFDEWNSLAVYVSMGNTVVIEDIRK
eukprot:XP_027303659.1 uncharacterized protein LOC113841135 isoform X3 [Anas platyrhynchos]